VEDECALQSHTTLHMRCRIKVDAMQQMQMKEKEIFEPRNGRKIHDFVEARVCKLARKDGRIYFFHSVKLYDCCTFPIYIRK
jgi:hypothetical protein